MQERVNQRGNSSLTSEYYQKLLELLNTAIAAGDLSGGSAFDKSSLLKLESQAQSFASLPLGTAGVRVMDDSFNYPLTLLEARLKSLAAEAGNFTTVSGRLLDILSNETALIDEILAADELRQWKTSLPQLDGAWSTAWDFRIARGKKSFTLAPVDPVNSVEYDADLPTGQVFSCAAGAFRCGLLSPVTARDFAFKSMSWVYATSGETQQLTGPDMTWPLPRRAQHISARARGGGAELRSLSGQPACPVAGGPYISSGLFCRNPCWSTLGCLLVS